MSTTCPLLRVARPTLEARAAHVILVAPYPPLIRQGGTRLRSHTTIRAGGIALIAGALAFLTVFSFLAARFDYPAVLDGSAAEVLPKLLATGTTGRLVWAVYAFLPLVWIPAGVAAFHALRPVRE